MFGLGKTDKYDWSFMCSVVTGLADAVVLIDRDFHLIDCNRLYVQMTGQRRRKLMTRVEQGASVFELLSESPEIERGLAMACIESGKPNHVPWVAVRNEGGGRFEVMRTFVPVATKGGEVAGVFVMYRDVSAEAHMHDQYKEMIAKEAARAEELDRQVTLRTEQLRTALDEVTRLSRIDPLTGVLNRRAFTEHANQALALARRHERHCAILMCDLDFFKSVNDTYGHSAGDSLLCGVASGLNELVRGSDKVARFGGEEFVVLLAETEADAVHLVCERVRQKVADLPIAELVPGKEDAQTVSVGAAVFPVHGDTIEKLIENADKALYSAKQTGRDRSVIYRPDLSSVEHVKTPETVTDESRRVLIVDEDEGRLLRYRASLGDAFYVAVATSVGHALSACRRERFDVIVADEKVGGDRGIAFLHKSLDLTPSAVRVLLIEAEDGFVSLLGANRGRVDHFLLRRDAEVHLESVVRDGVARRELALQELLANTDLSSASPADSKSSVALDLMMSECAFRMAYQPIVDVATGEVEAYEALCRPFGDDFAHPGVVFDVALETGKIWPLGDLIREAVADDMARLKAKLFVNLHPAELANPRLLSGHPFAREEADRIVYEITERSSITDLATFQEHLAGLRGYGFRFAIDDLGAGYASLNSVALVGPEYIKVDMTLIRDIDKSDRKRSLVTSLASFANSAGIRIIAEGVETEAEASTAAEVGCHLLQGFLLGRPMVLD